jgi:hypothetical protein
VAVVERFRDRSSGPRACRQRARLAETFV